MLIPVVLLIDETLSSTLDGSGILVDWLCFN